MERITDLIALQKAQLGHVGPIDRILLRCIADLERYRAALQKTKPQKASKALQGAIVDHARGVLSTNLVKRHQSGTPQALCRSYDAGTVPANRAEGFCLPPEQPAVMCYGCTQATRVLHPDYVFSCTACGDKFAANVLARPLIPLAGRVALVTGCRTKLGHQIVLRLLREGVHVVGLTRRPVVARKLFEGAQGDGILDIYPVAIDFDGPNLARRFALLRAYIHEGYGGRLDILVNNAAQTIRVREKIAHESTIQNRYGDDKHTRAELPNSWAQSIMQVEQAEMEELFRVNAIAPLMLFQAMRPLMDAVHKPFVLNVHAREGLFNVSKSDIHIHTNMAKAAMGMFTATLAKSRHRATDRSRYSIHGCDPGWISVDEYYAERCPWLVPPLTEVDGAARILFPLWRNLNSVAYTRRHYTDLVY
jgi:NAD(P)-dependent dehydrogenase (short-subunit alcohol dehydrogenase family)